MALHTVAQLNIACERLSARLPVAWLETFKPQSQDWTLISQNAWARWSCTTAKREVPHHAFWEVKSYRALSCLSIAAPNPRDSHYSSAPFFIATGYKKRLVTSESCRIQGLSSEATIMTIRFSNQGSQQKYHTLDAPGGEKLGSLEKHRLLIGNVVWHMCSA